jgi:hypothetical protein
MSAPSVALANTRPNYARWWPMTGLLALVLAVLFHKSFVPHQILFANDGPLGFLTADCNRLPARFTGTWRDLGWLGGEAPSASPTISMLMLTVFSPEVILKIYAPFTLLFVGFSAWVFFRQLQFNPMVCLLGAVAAGLNMHFFSVACWGLGTWNIAAGMAFLALAALSTKSIPQFWAKAILAGLAVGMGLMEGFDLGAILSVYVGVFVVVSALIAEAPAGQKIVRAFLSEALVIFFAGFIAAHTILSLVQTQVEGVAAMEQDVVTKQQRWNGATQWSLPKLESLEILVPGLFGYRMARNITEHDHSSAYWGLIGQDPRIPRLESGDTTVRQQMAADMKIPPEMMAALDNPAPQAHKDAVAAVVKKTGIYWRYSGTGECAGVLVSLLAIFALANLWRANSPLSRAERLSVGFWGLAAVFSLLASWGRYGFLYRLLYQLPYFSTIRNPIKFLHPFHIAWIILAAYGMEALWRRYLRGTARRSESLPAHLQLWWAKVSGFEKKWTVFSLLLIGAAVVGCLLLQHDKPALIAYLENQDFTSTLALEVIQFSLSAVVWFVVYLVLSAFVLIAILSGAWIGSGARTAWILLALLMIADLARADAPWVRYYDYSEKYSLNPVVDFLQDKPYEHRVIGKLEPKGPGSGITSGFGELYFFWLQNDFPYHNIQTLDFPQMPRTPELDRAYLKTFELQGSDIRTTDLWPAMRLWQLTNTRYLLSMANTVDLLNNKVDPSHNSFRVQGLFDMHQKAEVSSMADFGDLTVDLGPKGGYAVVEYTGALPRAKLYAHWETTTNDAATLHTLASRDFDPAQTVLVWSETPLTPSPGSPTADPGTVTITQYRPKRVQLQAEVKTPAVLLFNDHIGSDWKLWVDQKPAPILRCNYIMRGVFLTPGSHTVDFRFLPSLKALYLSLSAFVAGMVLAGYLLARRPPVMAPAVSPETLPSPAPPGPAKPLQPSLSANLATVQQKGKGASQLKAGPRRKS